MLSVNDFFASQFYSSYSFEANLRISVTFEFMMQSKEILVTGGAGYIGSHTVVELIESGYTPIIVDDFRNSKPFILERLEKISGVKVTAYNIDVCSQVALRAVFEKHTIQGVIHFAADKAVGESVDNPLKYYENNIGGLVSVLKLAEEFEVQNFVFSSSCTVYGTPSNGVVVNEDSELQEPSSPYGRTKSVCEAMIHDVFQSGSNMRFMNLRYFNPVGAHPSSEIGELPIGRPNNLLPFVTQTAAGVYDELIVYGNDYNTEDGTCIRDFIHVVDLADAHVKSITHLEGLNQPIVETLNLGTGKGTSVLEIIHTFEEVSGIQLNWKFGPRRAGDVEAIYADTARAKQVLGWETERTIKDSIVDAWNWEKKIRSEK